MLHDNSELFIPSEQLKGTVAQTLFDAGRMDMDYVVRPIEVMRTRQDPGMIMGAKIDSDYRRDIFVPRVGDEEYTTTEIIDGRTVAVRNSLRTTSFGSALYTRLTGQYALTLSSADRERLTDEQHLFVEAVQKSTNYALEHDGTQLTDAYHLSSNQAADPEIADTRLYIAGGLEGLSIVRTLVEEDVAFTSAKIWVPAMRTERQRFRKDTPIITVNTKDQLHSTIGALREIMPTSPEDTRRPLLGHIVDGLPNVYVGQTNKGASFNGTMQRLFGIAIQEASQDIELQAGDRISDEALAEIAMNARLYAQRDAEKYGVSRNGHAFVKDQNAQEMRNLIESS